VYRRICFLRFEGRPAEAQVIEETEFAEAAAKARGSASDELEAESILRGIRAEEEERVAGAIAFAEVLVPMLAKRAPDLAPARAAAPAPRRAPLPATGESRGIADFIDDMLAQERAGPR
jgi:hypothetical protein